MLTLLDNLLRQVLMNNVTGLRPVLPTLPVAVVSPEQVRFEPPDDDWLNAVRHLQRNALSVYLTDLRENRKLRSNERTQERDNGVVFEEPAPARLDCHYLISAFSPTDKLTPMLEPALDEHSLLYEVAAVLLREGSLNPDRVYPQAVNPWPPRFQSVDLPMTVAPIEGFPKLAEFWGTMGRNHRWRPVLYLIVTIPVALVTEQAGYMVTTRITEYRTNGNHASAEVLIEIGSRVILPPRPLAVGNNTVSGILAGNGVRVNSAAPFRVGDVVTQNDRARATITQIAGNDLILSNSLAGLAAGTKLRIANITPSQDTFRINDLTGLTPGGPVWISGEDAANPGTTVTERALIQSIAGDGFVTLAQTPPRTVAYNMNVPPANAPALKGFAAGTWVQLADTTGMERGTTTTDIDGRFKFAGLGPGVYSLKVRAPGFQPATINVTVPSSTGNYDVQLST